MSSCCPCGAGSAYKTCCGVYIEGNGVAPTPVALMRSRYTAYSLARIDYIVMTMQGRAAKGFDPNSAQKWAKAAKWIGLIVIAVSPLEQGNTVGYVEFVAQYEYGGQMQKIHEKSRFEKVKGQWFYVAGEEVKTPIKHKVGRNDSCPCGSGKKYKKCCLLKQSY